jgi:alkylation response protein AidB-like acyl-CoA dehydrogenase
MCLTWALFEDRAVITSSDIEVSAVKLGDEYIIRGTKIFVSDAHVADYIICVARTTERERAEYGISLFLVDPKSKGLQITPLKTLAGDKQYEVIFDNVAVPADNIVGRLNEGWQIVRSVAMKAMVGRCAEMVGASRQLLEITLEYIKERKAFGHPIGSFQAIQHYMANSAMAADGCSLMVYNAAWRLSQGLPAALDVSATKVLINESFKKIAAACIQSHGAIAFTEEHDVPLYYRRAKAWEMSYGDSHDHRRRIAELSGI